MAAPNNSMPIIQAAIGAFVVPPKTATNPIAAKRAGSFPVSCPIKAPKVAPTKKMGVTTPPLPPKLSVTDVTIIFKKNRYHTIFTPLKMPVTVLVPSPSASVPNKEPIKIIILPPMSPFSKKCILILFVNASVLFITSINKKAQIPKATPARATFRIKNSLIPAVKSM